MMRVLMLMLVGFAVVAVADDQMQARVGKLWAERAELLVRLRQLDVSIAAERKECSHPAEQQTIDQHIYVGSEFVCEVCGERRSTWPAFYTFENGHYRPTSQREFSAAKAYLERVQAAEAESRRLRIEVDAEAGRRRVAEEGGESGP